MQVFYRALVARLGARTRMIFARKNGEDVGFILGGVRDGTFRGFQFSYDERLKDVSLGGLLQLEQIRDLAAEGITTYDMGMDLEYKRRWADQPMDTVTIAVVRRSEGAPGAGYDGPHEKASRPRRRRRAPCARVRKGSNAR
jgi:CelD/BcsL family acetyltransferase involved in cellulose biosynthesis